MGQLNVMIGGRSYPLACRDGEEDRLGKLAGHIDAKAAELTGALGQMSEPRLLLMAAILIADEMFEGRERPPVDSEKIAGSALARAAERIETIAAALEQQVPAS